jgi:hypothetical protein
MNAALVELEHAGPAAQAYPAAETDMLLEIALYG